MLASGQVGPITQGAGLTPGSQPALRLGNQGELIATQLHGRYYENTYRRGSFVCASSAPNTTSVASATAATGLIISNPIGSGVNLAINKVGYVFSVAFAAAAIIGIACNSSTGTSVIHTAAATPRQLMIGTPTGALGLVDTSATLPAAAYITHVLTSIPAAGTGSGIVDLEGSLVLAPGAYAHIYTSTASGASGFSGFFSWEEIPI